MCNLLYFAFSNFAENNTYTSFIKYVIFIVFVKSIYRYLDIAK